MIHDSGIPAFWRAVIVVAAAYLFFDNAFPPLLPRALLILYMAITLLGVLLYFAADDRRWAEFKRPVAALIRDHDKEWLRRVLLVAIPLLAGYAVYDATRPADNAPVTQRQAHPAPPASIRLFGKTYDLATLENPVRREILDTLATDRESGWKKYTAAVRAGRDLYYRNCLPCHGARLDGRGRHAPAFRPAPVDFQDPTIIPQLQESFLFWRIATGGPGLPREGAPWDSAMPVWREMLNERDIWNLILFLFDYSGQTPRIWNPDDSRVVSAMRDERLAQRRGLGGRALYRFRCAVCHGEQGAGDGPAAECLYPRPRDFTLALFKYKSSPGAEPPRDEDLFNTIKYGLPGTAMAGWGIEGRALLSDAQIRSLIPVIKRFDISATWAPEDADEEAFDADGHYLGERLRIISDSEPLAGRIAYSAASVARGREAFLKACKPCHGARGRGNITSGKRLRDDWGQRIWPRDLTKPWTWRATQARGAGEAARERTIENIYTRISIGIPGTPMPPHRATEQGNRDPVSREDRWHIANFVYSLRESPRPAARPLIRGEKVAELPLTAEDARWEQAPAVTLHLAPNLIKEKRLFTPLNDALTVRALYDDNEVALLLELNDRTRSRPGDRYFGGLMEEGAVMYPDAFAIQFPRSAAGVEKPLYRHGDARRKTTIWYWNAGGSTPEARLRTRVLEGGGPDKRLKSDPSAAGLTAVGAWRDGRWRLLIRGPRNHGDAHFEAGRFIPVSFANWDGSNGEKGSRHSLTGWCWLMLAPEVDRVWRYGAPAGVALLLFLAGWALVAFQRRR